MSWSSLYTVLLSLTPANSTFSFPNFKVLKPQKLLMPALIFLPKLCLVIFFKFASPPWCSSRFSSPLLLFPPVLSYSFLTTFPDFDLVSCSPSSKSVRSLLSLDLPRQPLAFSIQPALPAIRFCLKLRIKCFWTYLWDPMSDTAGIRIRSADNRRQVSALLNKRAGNMLKCFLSFCVK